MICSKIPKEENIEIVLIGSGTKESLIRLNGFIKDLIGGIELKDVNNNIKFKLTNDYKDTFNSNIVICSAGKCLQKKKKKNLII